jgi:hypothetical protein
LLSHTKNNGFGLKPEQQVFEPEYSLGAFQLASYPDSAKESRPEVFDSDTSCFPRNRTKYA